MSSTYYIGFMDDGRLYGPADPEMTFEDRVAAVAFAREEAIMLLEEFDSELGITGRWTEEHGWSEE